MPIRALEIERLRTIADRSDLMPGVLRPFPLVLIFEILYDADLYRYDRDARGGSWGEFFDHTDRRAANVVLALNGFVATTEEKIVGSRNEAVTLVRYETTDKGTELLDFLKRTAGIE